jgi:hypothetical protein
MTAFRTLDDTPEANEDRSGADEPHDASSPSSDLNATGPAGYEPPRVEPLGTLPASTGMPASPQQFPNAPERTP